MSVIPSIILSAVLACGGCPAPNSNAACGTYESLCGVREILCGMGVDFCPNTDCGYIEDFLNDYFNCGNQNSGNGQTAPVPEITIAPALPEVTPPAIPQITPEPALPEATMKPVIPIAAPTRAPQATQAPQGDSSYAYQVVELVNQERAKYGLSALSADETLMRAAQTRAVETVRSFAHTRPDGSNFSSVLSEYGVSYRSAGENIAYGQRTPQEVVTAWMNSSGHRANILNSRYGKIGVGCYKNGSTYYWSQLFTD